MTIEIAFTLILLVLIMLSMTAEWLPIDLTALSGLILLVMANILNPEQALSVFSNDVIFILASIFIISGALAKSGLTRLVAEFILKRIKNRNYLTAAIMTFTASISAFFNNTNATAMLIPVTLQVARQSGVHSGRLLMPLAYASILGGTCTLIGTSTNIASAGLLSRLGLEPFSLFEFVIPGITLSVIGIAYFSLIGYRLLPEQKSENFIQGYHIRDYLSELLIDDDSPAIGDTVAALQLDRNQVTPLAIVRNNKSLIAHGNRKLEAGDKIIVKSSTNSLLQIRDSKKFSVLSDSQLSDEDISIDDQEICEVLIMPQSSLQGKTLKQIEFQQRYQVSVLAIYRRGQAYPTQIQNIILRTGDLLLLQGPKENLARLASYPDLWVSLTSIEKPLTVKKGLYVLFAMIGALLLVSLSILPPSIAFLSAVVAIVITGCTTMQEAYASIEWRVLVLIACMGAFGQAMQTTGTAAYLAEFIAEYIFQLGLQPTLLAFALLTIILTQPMSNAAAALVVLPVAISTAEILGVAVRPFAVMVTLSASLSFITPLEPASLLVYGTGKYRFLDFVKVGFPLTVITVILLTFIIPWLWPFQVV